MAFNKKNKRKITVDENVYYWSATGDDDCIGLCVMTDSQAGSKLFCGFDYHHIPVKSETASGLEYTALTDQFVITPFIVRQVVLYALSQGWKPFEKGVDLKLGAMDDKIDLRLDKNRAHNFKKKAHLKISDR